MNNGFDDWEYSDLLYLFCLGCVTERIQQHKLSHSAMFAFPSLNIDAMLMFEELIEAGWTPDTEDVDNFVHYLRVLSGRDVRVQGTMVQ